MMRMRMMKMLMFLVIGPVSSRCGQMSSDAGPLSNSCVCRYRLLKKKIAIRIAQ